MRYLIAFLLFSGSALPALAQGKLTITITGLRSSQGQVLIKLCDKADGFPNDAPPVKALKLAIQNNTASTVVEGLPPGNYAVVFFHDENSNGKLDTNFMGIPKEGYGASNNAKGTLGPPKFQDARFQLSAQPLEVKMQPSY